MAATRVFNTTELLEAILLELPSKDILSSKAVSCEWKSTIEDSIKLGRSMFLVADGTPIRPLSKAESKARYPDHNGPAMLSACPRSVTPILTLPKVTDYDISHLRSWVWEVRDMGHLLWHACWWGNKDGDVDYDIRLPPAYQLMYLTQPPIIA